MRVSNSLNAVDFRIGCTFTANCDFLLVWIALPKNHSFYLLNMLPAYYKNKLAIGILFSFLPNHFRSSNFGSACTIYMF